MVLIWAASQHVVLAQGTDFGQTASNPRAGVDRWEDKILIELSNDTWLDVPSGVELRPFSPGFNAYFFSDHSFGKSDFSFAWGFGVAVDNVHSNAAFAWQVGGEGQVEEQGLFPFPDSYEYERNKFVSTFLELPLELRYIQTDNKPFKVAIGFRLGYMVSNHQKLIDSEGKRKFYDFDGLNRFRYGLSARVGVGKVQVMAYYSLVPLLEAETDVVAASVGLAFTPLR